MTDARTAEQPTLFGHPTGLFTLFFAEMWERFSYYGMRALLVFYMIKGFLGYGDKEAYAVYGAYTALVYMTPYIGGMLADRVLGQRKAVVLGGLLMAAGHLLMTIETSFAFFGALALLIAGNGFFKPNISTIVGGLYPKDSTKKDPGFTIFYMGINLGAAMSPILCGYVGETYGWHYGFGLATIGMLLGVMVFVAPTRLTQLLIGGGALITAGGMLFLWDSPLQFAVRIFLAAALLVSGGIAVLALNRGGLPKSAGAPRDPEAPRRKIFGFLRADVAVYLGALVAVPLLAFVVQRNQVALVLLTVTGAIALGYIGYEAVRATKVDRQRIYVILILMFFSLLFWAFFEQAGSSVNNFTDRNVDRVIEARVITEQDVGQRLAMRIGQRDPEGRALPELGQGQLGYEQNGKTFTMTELAALREQAQTGAAGAGTFEWEVLPSHVGMPLGGAEIPASEFQAANPIFILLFGLVFSALWVWLARRKMEPSTPVKFALGILQLGLGFGVLWWGAQSANESGMVWMGWLLLGYLLHTTGELCISPVGLSMITKLSPTRIVSTVMGAWFLATAFSNFLAGMIAALTGVQDVAEDGAATIPAPIDTVHVYGGVFGQIALVAIGSAVVCLALAPLLKKWMHEEAFEPDQLEPLAQGAAASKDRLSA
jgi:proton-dependent oligopeptide transporter, POT family